MRRGRAWGLLIGSALAAGCALTPKAPVTLVGAEADRHALAGRWVGEYSSSVTGREGTIVFDLTATADTARGEVWMIARRAPSNRSEYIPYVDASRPGEVLTIFMVRVEGGFLTGVLDPYFDPDTGAELVTIFRGRLEGDVISGEFASTNQTTGDVSTGRWKVERQLGKAADQVR